MDVVLTGIQTDVPKSSILVSKTDPRGFITYANPTFCAVAGYQVEELLGKPHNIIRHPEMPRSVFSLMWDTLQDQKEFFGYVKNRCSNGNHYWVFAHVVPDIHPLTGDIIGYHSSRRWAEPQCCKQAMDVYYQLLEAESNARTIKLAVIAGRQVLDQILTKAGMGYEEWVFRVHG